MRAAILRKFRRLPWYVGRLGTTVRVKGAVITMPSRYTAGLLRLGAYESPELAAIRFLPRDRPVLECGGGVGVIACVIGKHLRPGTPHVVVEASPTALPHLRHNNAQNGSQFTIVEAAIANTPTVTFDADPEIVSGRVGGKVTVKGVTLETIAATHLPDGSFSLVCDIEGAEVQALVNTATLARIETVIVERHPRVVGADADDAMHQRLLASGLRERWNQGDVWVYQR
jgi:FkbM family methyltransferase